MQNSKQILFIAVFLLSIVSCEEPEELDIKLSSQDAELIAIEDLTYSGAFRLKNGNFGVSSINYAVGAMAYNSHNRSLFIAGNANRAAIAEYPIVEPQIRDNVAALPETGKPLQPFVKVLNVAGNPEGINRITGMLWLDGALIVNAEKWYDASGQNKDTTILINDADNLAGAKEGYFELSCRANCAGYMGAIPERWRKAFAAEYFTGWSSVYSIASRYSIGPSLWAFDPIEVLMGNAGAAPAITATPFMNYAHPDAISALALRSANRGESGPFPHADKIWNLLSEGRYGFFIEGTRTFAVIGSSGGLNSGIGYKIVQSNGNLCEGYCPYEPDDIYNYYWLFDVEDILDKRMPIPYDYGIWQLPFDQGGKHNIIGAAVDNENRRLYIALRAAGQVRQFDRPPLIITYHLP